MCFFDRAGENGGKLHVLRRDKLLPKHTARTVNAKNRSDLTLGRTRKFIPPLWYKGGGGWVFMEPLPRVFDMLQYLGAILPFVESL